MERTPAVRRSQSYEDKPTFDIIHAWPNDVVHGGVKFMSWIAAVNRCDAPVKIRAWVPGQPAARAFTIAPWGTWAEPCKEYGSVSVVVDQAPHLEDLHIFWELTAVKA